MTGRMEGGGAVGPRVPGGSAELPAALAEELRHLVAQHRLPTHLERMVLDGRLTLEAAVLRSRADRPLTPRKAESLPSKRPAAKPAEGPASPGETGGELHLLARQHVLPAHLERMVVDGRLTLEAAVLRAEKSRRRIRTAAGSTGDAPDEPLGWGLRIAGTVFLLAVLATVWLVVRGDGAGPGRDRRASMARPAPKVLLWTEVQRDADGRVAQVTGPDPASVLVAFCRASAGATPRDPIEIMAPVPARVGVKIGVFVDRDVPGGPQAIEIKRRGGAANDWIAGGGPLPVGVFPAPDPPPGTPRVPVDSGAL